MFGNIEMNEDELAADSDVLIHEGKRTINDYTAMIIYMKNRLHRLISKARKLNGAMDVLAANLPPVANSLHCSRLQLL